MSAQCSVIESRHCKHFLNTLLYILSFNFIMMLYATKFEVKKKRGSQFILCLL